MYIYVCIYVLPDHVTCFCLRYICRPAGSGKTMGWGIGCLFDAALWVVRVPISSNAGIFQS